jgi:hypothetical protein
MMHLDRHRSTPAAVEAVIEHLQAVELALPKTRRIGPVATGLNMVFSDGRSLHAFAGGPARPGRDKTALCSCGWPYWSIAYRRRGKALWVSSEPLDRHAGWLALECGHLFSASLSGNELRVRIRGLRSFAN